MSAKSEIVLKEKIKALRVIVRKSRKLKKLGTEFDQEELENARKDLREAKKELRQLLNPKAEVKNIEEKIKKIEEKIEEAVVEVEDIGDLNLEVLKELSVEDPVDLTKSTVLELCHLAKEKGIKGYSNMNKSKLIEALS